MHFTFQKCFFFVMNCNLLMKYLEDWAPQGIAWDKDNVGLQVGSPNTEIANIFICLELTEKSLEEAVKKKCNVIFTHHPLIFNPIKKIDTSKDLTSQLIQKLIKNDITLFSLHTNLDFTKDGVSFQLAKKIELKKIKFLSNLKSNQFKLVVFVPQNALEKVSNAIFNSGGGMIGEYEKCSFRLKGNGTFFGSEDSNPAVGSPANFEVVDEYRLEVLVNSWSLNQVISEMLKAHPYEQPAYDIYPLANNNVNYGIGAIGELEYPYNELDFIKYISLKLQQENFRYSVSSKKFVLKVAVCGGAGSEFINDAISKGADAFITADIKYHTFQEYQGKILLIDAGHYETEIHSLNEVKRRIENFTSKSENKIKVFIYNKSTNPIKFFNNK